MDPIGFNPYQSGASSPNRDVRDVRALSNFKRDSIKGQFMLDRAAVAFEAYINIKDGVAKGRIPTDIYNNKELGFIKDDFINPLYQHAITHLKREGFKQLEKDLTLEAQLAAPGGDKQYAEFRLANLQKAKTQIYALRDIEELAKPEFREAKETIHTFFEVATTRKRAQDK